MSKLSSETIFHFANRVSLLGILENDFYPHWSVENFDFVGAGMPMVIPLLCFCDIPLGQIHEHINDYGKYGIGMKKEWANKNKLNPVLYMENNSALSELFTKTLNQVSEEIESIRELGMLIDSQKEMMNKLIKMLQYCKQFEGRFSKGSINKDKKFYNEREWRYVPDIVDTSVKYLLLPIKDYIEPLKTELNRQIQTKKLTFSPSDINYLIIEEENDRIQFINEIDRIKAKYSDDDRKILKSKILSSRQIFEDF